MIANRPDWCISRQRNWGVPLPFFLHKDDRRAASRHAGAHRPRGRRSSSRAASRPGRGSTPRECSAPTAEHYAKSNDILDVWFDSGSTFFHVLRGTIRARRRPTTTARPRGRPLPRRPRPAPRLVPLVAADRLRDRGPRAVPRPADARLHGRRPGPQDEQERSATSSSLREVDAASSAPRSSACGAPRPTTPATSAIDDKILARVVDAYRRIRNTLRFLLANTSDFDAARRRGAARPRCSRSTAGRWRARRSCRPRCWRTTRSTSSTRWSPSCRCSAREDLGAFYLDVLKDRLYTTAPKSPARRSAQTALWHITHAMLRWMAPFLSFTAEEAWKVFAPSGRPRSSPRPTATLRRAWDDEALLAKWQRIREIRDEVNKADRGAARRGQGRLVAAGRGRDRAPPATTTRCWPRSATTCVRAHHVGRALAASRRRAARSTVTPSAARQVRALLALARRRRRRSGAPDDLRPLHQQPVRRRRDARRVA